MSISNKAARATVVSWVLMIGFREIGDHARFWRYGILDQLIVTHNHVRSDFFRNIYDVKSFSQWNPIDGYGGDTYVTLMVMVNRFHVS